MTIAVSTPTWADVLMTDHETTERVFAAFERMLAGPLPPSATIVADALEYFTGYVEKCHSHKEEDYLFPMMEAAGMPRQGGPLAVMLSEHERSEALLGELKLLAADYVAGRVEVLPELRRVFTDYAEVLKGHFWKENDILFPMARRILSELDLARLMSGIEAVEARFGPDTRQRYYALAQRIVEASEVKDLSAGLQPHVLAAILNTLPIELSFVDADDRVQYFSHEHHTKIFPRTRGAIGRLVQQCHPPKSVHNVNAILKAFKTGERNVAEFWLDMGPRPSTGSGRPEPVEGRKVHIRYFAVRSPEGEYLGTLETTQDIAPIQQLTGQRRLVDDALA